MKRILLIVLSGLLLIGSIACVSKPSEVDVKPVNTTTQEPEVTEEPKETENPEVEVTPEPTELINLEGNYYEQFVAYLEQNKDDNFIASPTSLRAALCLAIAGADNDTLSELLKGAGFNSKEEAIIWYNILIKQIESFNMQVEEENKYSERKSENFFELANSIWNNLDNSNGFKPEYIDYVKEKFNSEVRSEGKSTLKESINSWVNEKTRGMIPSIVDSVDDMTAALINALYLKTAWIKDFDEYYTKDDDFTCKDGTKVTKSFMEQLKEKYSYYKDNNTQLVVLPMKGNIYFVCVIGSTTNLYEKLKNTEFKPIHLKIPKLDIESTFEREMINFLVERGTTLPFTDSADFKQMCIDENWFIKDIIQKAKIKSDENGLEAAAVTAIIMNATSAIEPEVEEPIDFIANEPFSFFIFSDLYDNPEMLFCGQVVN